METNCYAGLRVTPFYDPLLAKLIVTGVDRPDAVARLQTALHSFEVGGIATNIPFLRRLTSHPDWVKGDFDTSFVPRMLDQEGA